MTTGSRSENPSLIYCPFRNQLKQEPKRREMSILSTNETSKSWNLN